VDIDFPADFASIYDNQYGRRCALPCGAAITFLHCFTGTTAQQNKRRMYLQNTYKE